MNAELVRLKKLSLQADELHSAGRMEAARIKMVDGLELAMEIKSTAHFYFFQGELNYLDDHLLAATEYFRQAYQMAPKNLLMIRGLGVVYSKRNMSQKALALFDRAIRLHPHDFRIWRQKGVTHSKMKQFDEALDCFDRALDLEPNDYHSLRQRGVTLSNCGKTQEALLMFASALALNRNDFRSMYEKSRTLNHMGEGAEAQRVQSVSAEVEHKVTQVPPRESLLARIKMNRIRNNQKRMLSDFHSSLEEQTIAPSKKR